MRVVAWWEAGTKVGPHEAVRWLIALAAAGLLWPAAADAISRRVVAAIVR